MSIHDMSCAALSGVPKQRCRREFLVADREVVIAFYVLISSNFVE
jgi:hypothetical protein